ncbi:MAG: TRAP transporter substrate-binding protein DctP [Desulfobacter sp.]|nr:MAG: TRAP transporter substrate-binding protein DctP [Desulfobacter sp.]
MLKRLIPIAVSILVILSAPAFALTLKIATISPEGSMWMEKMRAGAKEVAEKTDNRVKFKFYPGGVMGNDKAVLRKIRIGQLQGGAVVAGSLTPFFPANQIYAQPMKFKSQEEVDYVRQHMDTFITEGLEKAGFVTFGLSGGGFAYIMSKEPIESVEDLQKRKVWIPDNDSFSQAAVKSFGVSPIPLPLADVRTSLQSGLIDTVGTSPVGAIVLQWHTQIKYVTNIPLLYLHAALAVDKKKFKRISAKDQEIVRDVMTRAFREIDRQNREDDAKAIDALKKQGIKFITPGEDLLKEWQLRAETASENMVSSGALPKEAVERLDALLSEYHKTNPENTGAAQ